MHIISEFIIKDIVKEYVSYSMRVISMFDNTNHYLITAYISCCYY